MKNNVIGKYEYTIHSYHADLTGKATLHDLLSFMQESAWLHAQSNNLGYEALSNENCFWVLCRMRLKINTYPLWGDKVTVHTWSRKPDSLMAYRDFEIHDANDNIIILGSSSWLIVDKTTYKPRRTDIFADKFNFTDRNALDQKSDKITEKPFAGNNVQHQIPHSAIDVNKHVNNTYYIRWLIDSFDKTFLLNNQTSEITINFMHESACGEHYTVNKDEKSPGMFVCNIVRVNDNVELARMLIEFKKVNN